ncbi:MAG: hypothetical protein ACRDP8_17195 [Actinopolymorphaceae bacterium]
MPLLRIRSAGKCREQTDDSDAALVFDHDRDGVDQILADDTYYETPGVHVVSVRSWNPFLGIRTAPTGPGD